MHKMMVTAAVKTGASWRNSASTTSAKEHFDPETPPVLALEEEQRQLITTTTMTSSRIHNHNIERDDDDDDNDDFCTESSTLKAEKAKTTMTASSTKASSTMTGIQNGGPTTNTNSNNSPSKSGIKNGIGFSNNLPDSVKLLIGAGGIYGAFLYYGSLQEDVFRYVSATDGSSFKQAWFLQVLEALANVIVGFVGMHVAGPTRNIPKIMFAISGVSQVFSKAFTSLALANGLSFPVATLAKSGKMAPVMAGSLFLGGASYNLRDYIQVLAIIGGTAIVSMGSKKSSTGSSSSMMGVMYICGSLAMDGVTAGYQKRLQKQTELIGVQPQPYDFMFWMNLFMFLTALVIAAGLGELSSGTVFCLQNPEVLHKIIKFSICSAIGQSFIFYTIAHFDPLILSTVTTTRKIFSVLLSIFLKGHALSIMGWSGIAMACGGILSELQHKSRSHSSSSSKKTKMLPSQS